MGRGQLKVDLALLREVLGLPDSTRIVGTQVRSDDFGLNRCTIIIDDPDLKKWPVYTELPLYDVSAKKDKDGTVRFLGYREYDHATPQAAE